MLINNKSLIKTINQLNLTDDEREKFNKISEDDKGNFVYNGKPIIGGATPEQVNQISTNKTNIATLKELVGDSSSGLVKAVTDNASQLDTKVNKTIYAKDIGFISNGLNDDTENFKKINSIPDGYNLTILFEETTIIGDFIAITRPNTKLTTLSKATIKLKDNSGLLDKIINQQLEPKGLIEFNAEFSGIEGIEIDGNLSNNYIELENGERYYSLFLDDNNLKSYSNGGYTGITLSKSNTYCNNCNIHHVSWGGIDLKYKKYDGETTLAKGKNIEVKNNKISYTARDSITVHSFENCYIEDNEISNCGWHNIHAYFNCSNIFIKNNKMVIENVNDLFKYYPSQIYSPSVMLIAGHSTYNSSVDNIVIENNTMTNSAGSGIMLCGYCSNVTVDKNRINGMSNDGIIIENCYGSVGINNNDINDVSRGIVLYNKDDSKVNVTYRNLNSIINIKNNTITNYKTNGLRCRYNNIANNIKLTDIYNSINVFMSNNILDSVISGSKEFENYSDEILNNVVNIFFDKMLFRKSNVILNGFNNIKKLSYDLFVDNHTGNTIYVDSVNGNDANNGSINKPYRTLAYALTQLDKNKNHIKLKSNFTEDLNIENVNISLIDNFIIEGDGGIKEVNSILIKGCNKVSIKNIKTTTQTTTSISIQQTNYCRLTNIDLTNFNSSNIGVNALHNTTVYCEQISISNKSDGFNANNLSKIFVMSISNTPSDIGCGYNSINGSEIILGQSVDISTTKYKTQNGGIIKESNGRIIPNQ